MNDSGPVEPRGKEREGEGKGKGRKGRREESRVEGEREAREKEKINVHFKSKFYHILVKIVPKRIKKTVNVFLYKHINYCNHI